MAFLGRIFGGGASLSASARTLFDDLPQGGGIAVLRNPFKGATTFEAVGAVPTQLAVSAGGVVTRGAGVPVAGQVYTVKVRSTSFDGKREVAESLSFTTIAVVMPVTPTLAGSIATIATGSSGSIDLTVTAGAAPLVMSNLVKPSWMTVTVINPDTVRVTWVNASTSA